MVQSPYSSFKLGSQLTWRCNWWYQITGKAEKKDKNLVLVSQCPVGLSNTHPHPHTQKLGRPTKWLLWFNHLLLLLQRWPNPASNLPQPCLQIFQVYHVEFFLFFFAEMTEQKPLCLQLAHFHHNVRPYVMVTGKNHSPQKHRCHRTTTCFT